MIGRVQRLLIRSYWYWRQFWEDWQDYSAELAGWVPSHAFRLWWYRVVCGMHIGRHSSIHRRCRAYCPYQVTIGDHTVINSGVLLDGRRPLCIGSNVSVSEGVVILTVGHDVDAPDFAVKGGPVTIADRVFVGAYARILPGVHIGEGAVVGAGSIVVRDVQPFTVVAGAPAGFVRDRSRNLTYELGYRKRFG